MPSAHLWAWNRWFWWNYSKSEQCVAISWSFGLGMYVSANTCTGSHIYEFLTCEGVLLLRRVLLSRQILYRRQNCSQKKQNVKCDASTSESNAKSRQWHQLAGSSNDMRYFTWEQPWFSWALRRLQEWGSLNILWIWVMIPLHPMVIFPQSNYFASFIKICANWKFSIILLCGRSIYTKGNWP